MSETNEQTPSAEEETPVEAPAEASENTPAENTEETVTLPKSEAEKLQQLADKEEEIAQREAKVTKRETKVKKARQNVKKSTSKTSSTFSFDEPDVQETTDVELEQQRAEVKIEREVLAVERGVNKLLTNPDYAEFLKANSIVADQLQKAPMGLHIFAIEQAIDAPDALSKIEDYLDEEVGKFTPSNKKDEKEEDTKEQPEAAPTNPQTGDKPEEKERENAGRKQGIFKSEVEQVGDKLADRISKGK